MTDRICAAVFPVRAVDLAVTVIVDFTSAIEIGRPVNLAKALVDRGLTDEAMTQLREALRIDPLNPDANNDLGVQLYLLLTGTLVLGLTVKLSPVEGSTICRRFFN